MTDLDRDVERLLITLSGGPMTTTTLRDELDLNQNQQILYRIENKVPDGFVEQREEQRHAGRNLKKWALTDIGQEWIEEHREEIERPANLSELIVELEELAEDLSRVEGKWGSIRSDLTEIRGRVQRIEMSVADSERKVAHDLEETRQMVAERVESLSREVAESVDRVEEIDSEMDGKAGKRELAELRTRLREESDRVDELQETFEGIEDDLGTYDEMVSVFEEVELKSISRKLDDVDSLEDIEERMESLPEPEVAQEAIERVDGLEDRIDDLGDEIDEIDEQAGEDDISQSSDIEGHLTKSDKIQKLESRISELEESRGGIWSKLFG